VQAWLPTGNHSSRKPSGTVAAAESARIAARIRLRSYGRGSRVLAASVSSELDRASSSIALWCWPQSARCRSAADRSWSDTADRT
jgi:hypothetical protein